MIKEFEKHRLECELEKLTIQTNRRYTLTGNQYMDMIDAFIYGYEFVEKLEKENEELKRENEKLKNKPSEIIYKEKIVYKKR